MKRTEPLLFSEIFNRVVEQSGHADTYAEQRACFVWPEVVGQGVNRYTTHRYVDHGTMINRRVGRNVITSITIH